MDKNRVADGKKRAKPANGAMPGSEESREASREGKENQGVSSPPEKQVRRQGEVPPLQNSEKSPSGSAGQRSVASSQATETDEPKKTFSRRQSHKNSVFGSSTTLSSNADSEDFDEHFNVDLRVRPLNAQEVARGEKNIVSYTGDGKVTLDNNGIRKDFQFNIVFNEDATQEDVFENSGVKKLVEMAISGYACTALAFGQTGSGKTHTMTGPPNQFQDGAPVNPKQFGLIQRAFKYMFDQLKQNKGTNIIRASYLEIYNEQVIDLLNANQRRYLQVRWSKNKGFYVENLFAVECETLADLMAVLEEGLRNRQSGSHGLNEFSSRSHSMLTVTIDTDTQDPEDDNLYVTKRGKLSFVDLAGSEKVKDVSTIGAVESNSINKSLLVLGKCISHLGDSKRRQGHIPYRDSKLTKLLADSLGGNGVTLMIACINPSSANATETSNTLRYATRAKRIKTKPTVKMDPREKLIMSLKREIKILRNENHYLRQQLEFPAKPRGQLQRENDEKFMKFLKEQEKKESGLYEMLQEYMVENEALRSENSDLHSVRDRIRQDQQLLYRDNEKLMRRVEELERIITQNPTLWNRSQPSSEDYRAGPRGPPPPNNDHYSHYNRPQPDPYGPPPRGQAGGDSYAPYDYPRRSSPQAPHPNHPGFQQHKPPPREAYPEMSRNPPSPQPNRRSMPSHGPPRPPHHLAEPIMRNAQPPMATHEPMHNGSYDNGVAPARQSQPSSPRGKAGSFVGSPRQRPPPPIPNGQPRPGPPQGRKQSISSGVSDLHQEYTERLMSEVEQLNDEITRYQRLNQKSRDSTHIPANR